MSINYGAMRGSHPATVGSVHVGFRDTFVKRGWGASSLAGVAAQHPRLMRSTPTRSRMAWLVQIENHAALTRRLQTRGDFLAAGATPLRAAAVHTAMSHNLLGAQGVRGLLASGNGYGRALFSEIVSGTF